MNWHPISKPLSPKPIQKKLIDHQGTSVAYFWAEVRQRHDGLPDGQVLTIACEAVDCHADGTNKNKAVLRWLAIFPCGTIFGLNLTNYAGFCRYRGTIYLPLLMNTHTQGERLCH